MMFSNLLFLKCMPYREGASGAGSAGGEDTAEIARAAAAPSSTPRPTPGAITDSGGDKRSAEEYLEELVKYEKDREAREKDRSPLDNFHVPNAGGNVPPFQAALVELCKGDDLSNIIVAGRTAGHGAFSICDFILKKATGEDTNLMAEQQKVNDWLENDAAKDIQNAFSSVVSKVKEILGMDSAVDAGPDGGVDARRDPAATLRGHGANGALERATETGDAPGAGGDTRVSFVPPPRR